jgi:hypothetical protein
MKTTKTKPKKKRGRGRPPMPKGLARSVNIRLRVTPALDRTLKTEAKRQGKTVAAMLLDPWTKGE